MIVKEENLNLLARKVIDKVEEKNKDEAFVVLLEGDLGAGKTTFTKHFAKCLEVAEEVSSPTFILKKEYTSPHHKIKKVIHIDAYRFDNPKEAKILRIEDDTKNKDNIILIEWPAKMGYIKSDMVLFFEVIDENTREVKIKYDQE